MFLDTGSKVGVIIYFGIITIEVVEKCAKRNINSTVINNYIPFEGKIFQLLKVRKRGL